jgi:hypothetical protein
MPNCPRLAAEASRRSSGYCEYPDEAAWVVSVYWSQVAQRLLAFALAFIVIGLPLAGDVCGAVCAQHAGHSSDPAVAAPHDHHPDSQSSHHHHSEAPPAPLTQSLALRPAPPQCGHLDAVVAESRELMRPHIAKAVVMVARITPALTPVPATSEMDNRHHPPTPTRSTSPLRL